jgi:Cdc6-like AAA superfamily ATPase
LTPEPGIIDYSGREESLMPGKYNPFRPNSVVTPGMFCGRFEEITTIDTSLSQTKHGNPQHFIILGERGIGKSSLFLVECMVATGSLDTFFGDKLNFIVVNITLDVSDTFYTIIKKIMGEFRRQLARRDKLKSIALAAWDFISRVEAAGVRVRGQDRTPDESELLGLLQNDFVKVLTSLGDEADGILLLIDEADKPPVSANLGLLCKLLTEHLTRNNCDHLLIGLAGLPSLVETLRGSHESSPRLFTSLDLKPLEPNEREKVIERGCKEANEKNSKETTITDEAKAMLSKISEGYPHFLQEFAYCAFENDNDYTVDSADVQESLFKENGAFDQLGKKYFDQYYRTPGSDDYRTVLDTMSYHGDEWVQRSQIIEESKLKASTVDNALRTLKGHDIIIQNPLRSGQYKLPTQSFAVWLQVRQFAEKNAENDGSSPGLFE